MPTPARVTTHRVVGAVLALCLGLLVTGCGDSTTGFGSPGNAPAGGSTGAPDQAAAAAIAQLATLTIKPQASMSGYTRDAFGPAWTDVDHNKCDTRDDILHRDLTNITTKPGTDGCQIATGILHDPYTGKTIHFVRGVKTSTAVQIDHIVALGNAWRTGAQALSAGKRQQLANDPIELLAVDGPANEAKSDQDASEWLPPNRDFACTYVADQIRVKATYGLWVTRAEHDALSTTLTSCRAPVTGTSSQPAATTSAQPQPGATTPNTTVTSNTTPAPGSSLSVVYPGAYCSPEGAAGVTSTGKIMKCASVNGDRPRWRS